MCWLFHNIYRCWVITLYTWNKYSVASQLYFNTKLFLSSNNLKFSWENKPRMSKMEIISIIMVKFEWHLLWTKYIYKHVTYINSCNYTGILITLSEVKKPNHWEVIWLSQGYGGEKKAELRFVVRQPGYKTYILNYCTILLLGTWHINASMPLKQLRGWLPNGWIDTCRNFTVGTTALHQLDLGRFYGRGENGMELTFQGLLDLVDQSGRRPPNRENKDEWYKVHYLWDNTGVCRARWVGWGS